MRSLILDLKSIRYPETGDGKPFWHDTRRLETIIKCVLEAGLGVELHYYEEGDSGYKDITPINRFIRKANRWTSGGHRLTSTPEHHAPSVLDLTIVQDEMRVMLILQANSLSQRGDVLDRLVDLVVRLRAEVEVGACFGRNLAIRATGIDWVRPIPPRTGDGYSLGVPVMLLSKAFFARADGRPGDLARLLAAELPAGAVRESRGDIVVLRFTQSVEEAEILAACAAQERWISETLDLPLAYS